MPGQTGSAVLFVFPGFGVPAQGAEEQTGKSTVIDQEAAGVPKSKTAIAMVAPEAIVA